jgi:EpsI family protein
VARDSLALFPLHIDEWRGEQEFLDASILRVLGADDYINASYVSGEGYVDLLMTFYKSQMGGSGGVHSPEVCLPAGGWDVSEWQRRSITVADQSITVNRAVIQKGQQRQLVYYWFEQRGTKTPSEYEAKFLSLRDAVAMGRSDGGLVRLVTPIGPTESGAAADVRLENFMRQFIPMLPSYFPAS